MPEDSYIADVAITPDGQVLAMVHEQILVFSNLKALGEFISRLEAKKEACLLKTSPIDDRTAAEAANEAISFLENMANGLNCYKDSNIPANTIPKPRQGVKMPEIMEPVIEFLKEDDWGFEQDGEILRIPVSGNNGKWMGFAQIVESKEQFVFYSICPVNVPTLKSAEMTEYLTRANYGITLGNFEMDLEDGEIRYKTSIDVEGDRLVSNLVRPVVYSNVLTMDQYLPGIMKVLWSDISPSQAVQEIETGTSISQAEPDTKAK